MVSECAGTPTVYMIPCVRLRYFVQLCYSFRFFFSKQAGITPILHTSNTRYGRLVKPYPTKSFTSPEMSSFSWRTTVHRLLFTVHLFSPITFFPASGFRSPVSCLRSPVSGLLSSGFRSPVSAFLPLPKSNIRNSTPQNLGEFL